MRSLAAIALLASVLLAPARAGAQDPERRAFEVGGPETLVLAGTGEHSKVTNSSRTVQPDGRVTGISISFQTIYHFSLYLDAEGAREAFKKFSGQDLKALLKEKTLQAPVINSDFGKLIVLSFKDKTAGRDIRDYLSGELEKSVSRRAPELSKFLDTFRGDFKTGDTVEIRISGDRVAVTVRGEASPEIQHRNLARALVKLHVEYDALSLVGPLLQ